MNTKTEGPELVMNSKVCRREYNQQYRQRNLKKLRHYNLWNNCRYRARKKGIEFSLTLDDILIPNICPILGIELNAGFDSGRDNSPSVDRVRLSEGYTPGNIQVISYLANRIKNNATLEQLVLVGEWAQQQLGKDLIYEYENGGSGAGHEFESYSAP